MIRREINKKNKGHPGQMELPHFGKPKVVTVNPKPIPVKPKVVKKQANPNRKKISREECLQRSRFFAIQGDVEMANYWKDKARE